MIWEPVKKSSKNNHCACDVSNENSLAPLIFSLTVKMSLFSFASQSINWYYQNYHKALLMKRIRSNGNLLLHYAWFAFDTLGLLAHSTFLRKNMLLTALGSLV